jgi:hypothetical protein
MHTNCTHHAIKTYDRISKIKSPHIKYLCTAGKRSHSRSSLYNVLRASLDTATRVIEIHTANGKPLFQQQHVALFKCTHIRNDPEINKITTNRNTKYLPILHHDATHFLSYLFGSTVFQNFQNGGKLKQSSGSRETLIPP